MRCFRFLAIGYLLYALPAAAVPLPRDKNETTCLDLQPKANGKLKESFHGGSAGNNLAEVPRGEQKFGGIKFFIGDGLIQLAGSDASKLPAKVEGIKVGRAFGALHILQACGTGYQTKDGAEIGTYTVHYHDKTTATINVVFGKDVRDWWYYPNSPGVTGGKVAWQGDNAMAKKSGAKVRLYLSSWKNPHPRKKVLTIDFGSTRTTRAQPFCVALTVASK
jgi:hypothetical protein